MAINPVQLPALRQQFPDLLGEFMRGREFRQSQENQNRLLQLQEDQFTQQQVDAEAARQAKLQQAEVNFYGRAGEILSKTDPSQQSMVYQQIRQTAIANGLPDAADDMPEQFSPDIVSLMQNQAALGGFKSAAGDQFTLGPDDVRFSSSGKEIARGTPKEDKTSNQNQVNKLRSTLNSNLADFRKVDAAFGRIKAVADKPTAAGDLALIFNFMKMLDPGSVVRESEFATAQNAAGVPDRIRNVFNRVQSGERLSPEQRADFVSQADNLFGSQQESADRQIDNILQQADQDEIPRQSVLGKKRLEEFESRFSLNEPPADPAQITQEEQTRGGQIMTDANGNRAVVFPDGTFREL